MDDRNATTNIRQMLLTSILLNVSARVYARNGERFDLRGQVLPLPGIDPELCSIELASEDGEKRMAETDDLGCFEFHELPRGTYQMIITGSGFEITMTERIRCDTESHA